MNSEDVIEQYKAAFELANGFKPEVVFRNGWYSVGRSTGLMKYRRSQIVEMTSNLINRAKEEADGTH